MGMCKECKNVFSSLEMKNGLCKSCYSDDKSEEIQQKRDMYLAKKLEFIRLKHKDTGVLKNAPVGFSWTIFFFSFWVPLIRGDIKWFIMGVFITFLTFGLGYFIISFIYNKAYIKDLMEKGYLPADEPSKLYLINKGIIST